MKNLLKRPLIFAFALVALASCSASKVEEQPKKVMPFQPEVMNIEPVKGRLNVYSSMARAAKYNTTAASCTLYAKMFVDMPVQNASSALDDILSPKENELNALYAASRGLDFAIVFAATHLTNDDAFIQNYIYQKSAQQLALATIGAHQQVLFAARKIKELDRRIAAQEKIVKGLNEKSARFGSLSTEDLEYKKTLEVSILKMQKMKTNLAQNKIALASLLKVDEKDLHLEGKNFYELQDFDAKNEVETFQNMAADNRAEFALARQSVYGFNVYDAQKNALQNYPEIQRLALNGVDKNNELYALSLENNARNAAQNLVGDVKTYVLEKDAEKKNAYLKNCFNQLAAAITVQVELDFYMVKIADFDFVQASDKAASLRSEIRTEERKKNLSLAALGNLADLRLKLDEQEALQTQISSERAMALRALYFHAGLSPFSRQLLSENLSVIESKLKKAFNQDMLEMLALAQKQAQERQNVGNSWAKKDNWLEILIDQGGEKKEKPITLPEKPLGEFDPYVGAQYDKMTVMQLGSYRYKENADIEWQMLKEIYPEFSNAQPKIESSMQGGKMLYRLILKSKNGGLMHICNKLRADKVECILRKK